MNFSFRCLSFCVLTQILVASAAGQTQIDCSTFLDANNGLTTPGDLNYIGSPLAICSAIAVAMWDGTDADITTTGHSTAAITASQLGSAVIASGLSPQTTSQTFLVGYNGSNLGLTQFRLSGGITHDGSVPLDGVCSYESQSITRAQFTIENTSSSPGTVLATVGSNFSTTVSDPEARETSVVALISLTIYEFLQGTAQPIGGMTGFYSHSAAGVEALGVWDGAVTVSGDTAVVSSNTTIPMIVIPPHTKKSYLTIREKQAIVVVFGPNAFGSYDALDTHTISLFSPSPGVTITAVPEPAAALLIVGCFGLLFVRGAAYQFR